MHGDVTQCSVVTEHSFIYNHHIQFHNTQILASKSVHVDQLMREVIELELHPDSVNIEDGLLVSVSWKPIFCSIRGSR
jgi:hypothetical protein